MGCDIHFYVEHKEENGEWREILAPNTKSFKYGWMGGRSYVLFAILADVRNNWGIEPIKTIKYKFPDDLSYSLADKYPINCILNEHRDTGYHSPRWISLKDIVDYKWDEVEYKDECKFFLETVVEEMKKIDDNYENVRAIFCFDN